MFLSIGALTYQKERIISKGDDTCTTRGEIMDRAEWHPYSPSGLASGGASHLSTHLDISLHRADWRFSHYCADSNMCLAHLFRESLPRRRPRPLPLVVPVVESTVDRIVVMVRCFKNVWHGWQWSVRPWSVRRVSTAYFILTTKDVAC